MCTDLFHLGRTDFIVDPGVRVAYEPQIAARANATEVCQTAVAYQPSVYDTALLPRHEDSYLVKEPPALPSSVIVLQVTVACSI